MSKKKYEFAIVFNGSYGSEEVDSFDTMKEAQAMLGEYRLAYRNAPGFLSIRKQRSL